MTDENDEQKAGPPKQEAPKAPAAADSIRHANGRIKKGFSGNPKGRPKKPERAWSNRQFNTDILLEANAEVAVTRNGKTELVAMSRLIIRQLLIKVLKSDNLREILNALGYIERAQSAQENRDWKFYQDLEQVEKSFEDISVLISEAGALEHRDKWRRKSRKI